MTRRSRFHRLSRRRVLPPAIATGCVLGLTLLGVLFPATVGQAKPSQPPAALKSYMPPPPNSGYQAPAPGGGVRTFVGAEQQSSCTSRTNLPLLALAPQFHQGQTSTRRPTLAWYVPGDVPGSLAIQVFRGTLRDFERETEPPLLDETLISRAGIMTWTVPQDLAVGETYVWRVVLVCDSNRPSLNLRDVAEFVVVAPTAARSADPVRDAQQMAESGIWYDALALTLSSPASPQLRSLRIRMLEALADLESRNDSVQAAIRVQALRRIVAAEQ
ncbi:DUF928 domain-containing protein [Leptolyngbya sp. O-77]|uniref:DUF928 domain-containing protein n=1 Tax=Leptolyngbya sp. O-77 TaxID=1080068 RepID=UPI00074D3090|nr:DUF928 domain-containing protein [Leptolyngbya sp. O-77]BAU43388.1 hypothetical protein O77CONTIG1_03217 [Leptolyngbya sp. O-77]